MPKEYSRLHRLLRIFNLIQSGEPWNVAALSERLKITRRTVYRDLQVLQTTGIPIEYDSDEQCYRLTGDFFMPPLSLTLDESLAVIALGEHIGRSEQIPLMNPAARAMEKLRGQLPVSIRDELSQLDKNLAIQLARCGPHEGIEDVYETIRRAIADRRVLKCSYESIEKSAKRNGYAGPFEFRPYILFFSQRSWYVIGYHCGHKELRCLKLNRFSATHQTDKPYAIPDDFSLDSYLGNAWRMIRSNKTYRVELHFDAEFAETVSDTHWHKTQEIEHLDDGSILFRCTVDGLNEIVWWVLGYGPHCTVRKPKALADKVLQLAKATTERYESVATEKNVKVR